MLIELDADEREKIEHVKALNSVWLEAAERNVEGVTVRNGKANFNARTYENYYGEGSISNDFWVDLLVELDEETLKFLKQRNVPNIGEPVGVISISIIENGPSKSKYKQYVRCFLLPILLEVALSSFGGGNLITSNPSDGGRAALRGTSEAK